MTEHVVKDCGVNQKEGCLESGTVGSIKESGGDVVGSETKLENAGRSGIDEEGDEECFKQQAEEAEPDGRER